MGILREGRGVEGPFLNLNLLPPAYRRRVLPFLPVSLGLLAAVGVMIFLGIYQLKAGVDSDVARLQADIQQAQRLIPSPPAALPGQTAQETGFEQFRVGWSRVLQTIIASLPSDARLQDVSFSNEGGGPRAIVKGEAAEYAAVVEYADNLRSSPFFSRVTVQSMGQSTPATAPPAAPVAAAPTIPSATPTPTLTPPMPTPILVWPSSTPSRAYTPTPTPTLWTFPITPTVTWQATTGTATRTRTATATVLSTYYDFVVAAKDQSCDLTAPANYSGDLVTGRVLDVNGSTMAGIRVRVTSIHAADPWSAEATTDGEGAFRFYLTKANFKAEVVSGSSQIADELWTRSTSELGVCWWHVTFKKNNESTPVPQSSFTPSITPTPSITVSPTRSPTMTPTPPGGTPVTGNSATASLNAASAGLAIDGNTSTMWSAGAGPFQFWEQTFDPTAYPNGVNVGGIGLLVSQDPSDYTTHVVHLYSEAVGGDELLNPSLTINGYTYEGQLLSRAFTTPVAGVKRMRIETTDGPSNVAWREIYVYMRPTSTATPTPTGTPTATATPRGQSSNSWQYNAFPISAGETLTRTMYNAADIDWAVVYINPSDPVTVTYSFRAMGSTGMDMDLEIWELNGDHIEYRAHNDNATGCGLDSIAQWGLGPGKTYYAKVSNHASATGSYALALRLAPITCSSALTLPGVAVAAGSPTSSEHPASGPAPPVVAPPSRGVGWAAPEAGPAYNQSRFGTGAPMRQPVTYAILLEIRSGGLP